MPARSAEYMVLHADLFVRSMDASLEFYCSKLGFSAVDDVVVRGPIVAHVCGGRCEAMRLVLVRISPIGALIELQELQYVDGNVLGTTAVAVRREGINAQPAVASAGEALRTPVQRGMVSILVADLEGHIRRAKNNGVLPASEVFTVSLPRQGICKIVFYKDPDGNDLEFVQVAG